MNFPQKRNVNVAAVSKRKHDLSHVHIGTLDFGRIKTIECRYMVPGDEFGINVTNETRVLNAMPSPTIGRFDVVYRHFFVPISHIWNPFYDFLKNQQTVYNGTLVNVTSAPYITLDIFLDYFCNPENGLVDTPVEVAASQLPSHNEYDFASYEGITTLGNIFMYKFTKKGRILNDFLTSLGINIPYAASGSSDRSQKLYIILPLCAFWKYYFDWIVPSRFIREHEDYIEQFIHRTHGSQLGNQSVSASDFFTFLLHEPLAYYEDDFFTTLTEFPFQSDNDLQDGIDIANPSSDFGFTSVNSSPDNGISGSFSDLNNPQFNMYTLQTLGKLQDLLNRNLIAGTKVQDWLLTEFGIKPNNDALHLSTYLGSKRTTLNVRDVISNADTESTGGVPLGSYAGYIKDGHVFDFGYKAQEHGFYFITYELVPRTSYFQGLHAQFDMGDRFDFFQPEFDNQQGAPVPFRRLFFSQDVGNQKLRPDDVFGFGLQYGDQKIAYDVVSGDFRTRFGLQLKSWFMARDMTYISILLNNIEHIEEEFCLVKSKYQDWHYIFSDISNSLDPFLCAWNIEIHAMRPMKSIVEGFEPIYQQSGKEVKLDFSGSVK